MRPRNPRACSILFISVPVYVTFRAARPPRLGSNRGMEITAISFSTKPPPARFTPCGALKNTSTPPLSKARSSDWSKCAPPRSTAAPTVSTCIPRTRAPPARPSSVSTRPPARANPPLLYRSRTRRPRMDRSPHPHRRDPRARRSLRAYPRLLWRRRTGEPDARHHRHQQLEPLRHRLPRTAGFVSAAGPHGRRSSFVIA